MTTSGTYTFTLTQTNIIKRAFNILNVYDLAATVSSDDLSFASDLLNGMLKSWEADGIRMSKRKQGYVFTAADTYQYDLGSASGAEHCTNSYVSTTVTSAASTVINVSSATGMTASDYIGIQLDNGTRFWSTISSISTNAITIASGITSAAAAGNSVVTYTTKLNRPLEIIDAVNIDLLNSNLSTSIGEASHDEFFKVPAKTTEGQPAIWYYDKQMDGAIPHTGRLSVFPTPDNVAKIIGIQYLDSIQDMTSSGNNADLPQEYLAAMYWGLAAELCVPYGRMQELEIVQSKADKYKAVLDYADADMSALKFEPKK